MRDVLAFFQTCSQIVFYLRISRDNILKMLPAESCNAILTELAMQVYGLVVRRCPWPRPLLIVFFSSLLLEHCKSFPVSFGGALIMTK